jgi:hypothetical protein
VRRAQSVSPSEHEHEHSRTRFVEKDRFVEKVRSPSIARRRSPSPRAVRYVEPSDTSEHIRIIERERERVPSPSPSPPPAPPVVRGPVIEREVITHYTDIDHGEFFFSSYYWSDRKKSICLVLSIRVRC